VPNAKPGEYLFWIWPEWGNGTIPEVTIRVTASEEVKVRDSLNNTN